MLKYIKDVKFMEWYHYLIAYIAFLIAINIVINIITIKTGYYRIMKKVDIDLTKDIQYILVIVFVILMSIIDYFLKKIFNIDTSYFLFITFFTFLIFDIKISKIIYVYNKRKKKEPIPTKPKEETISNNYPEEEKPPVNYYEKYFKKEKKSKEDKKKEALEKEMDLYNLEEWEKEEVRKGNFSPENFEDSEEAYDLEDDDYHFEDD